MVIVKMIPLFRDNVYITYYILYIYRDDVEIEGQ